MTSSTNSRTPLLTIAIPTFDREAFLRETLESIRRQTWQDFEIILFDNASPYEIHALAREFPSLSISIQRNETNLGNYANFKRAMSYPYRTPYIYILHDDDTIHPQYLETAIEALQRNSDIAWVGSLFAPKRSGKADMHAFPPVPNHIPFVRYTKTELVDAFMHGLPLGFSTVVYRSDSLVDIHPDHQRFNKWLDRPYLVDTCKDRKAAVFHFPFINYRVHQGQDSAQSYRSELEGMINLIGFFKEQGSKSSGTDTFTTTSSLRAAAANARSWREFKDILDRFRARGLYKTTDMRPSALYWTLRIFLQRLYRFLVTR
jgi:glycosyltransferase involved in cell wall biosynthesis